MKLRYIANLGIALLAIAISAIAMENGLIYAARSGWISVDLNPMSGFWADINPDFGVWHRANTTFDHLAPCFHVSYTANSYGAVDKERTPRSGDSRVVVLGDSMMEGYSLNRQDRLSDRLEQKTGVEYMNFATAQGFGPIQYMLMYETMAGKFDHDAVLVGFLPENDFTDSDWEIGQKVFYNRYRPYFVRNGGKLELIHFSEAFLETSQKPKHWYLAPFDYLWNDTMTFRTARKAYSLYRYQTMVDNKIVRDAWALTPKVRSFYYDYSPADLEMAKVALARLVKSANGRPVVVIGIPMLRDLMNFKERGAPPFTADMEKMGREAGFQFVDLLPEFAKKEDSWSSFYHSCDHHWTPMANAYAAEIIAPVMEQAVIKGRSTVR